MFGNCETIESGTELPAVMEEEKESKSLQATIIFRKPRRMLRPTLKNPTMIGSGVCKNTSKDYHRDQQKVSNDRGLPYLPEHASRLRSCYPSIAPLIEAETVGPVYPNHWEVEVSNPIAAESTSQSSEG